MRIREREIERSDWESSPQNFDLMSDDDDDET